MLGFMDTENWRPLSHTCLETWCLIKQGLKGGLLAGISLGVFQMITGWLVQGNIFYQMKMLAGMVVGPIALEAWHPLSVSVPIGGTILLLMSMFLAVVFVILLAYLPWPIVTPFRVMIASSAYGLAIWLVGFYVIAPFFGWSWFYKTTNPFLQGFIANVIFFGLVLGIFLVYGEKDGNIEKTER